MLIKLYTYKGAQEREIILNTAIMPRAKVTIWQRIKMFWRGVDCGGG